MLLPRVYQVLSSNFERSIGEELKRVIKVVFAQGVAVCFDVGNQFTIVGVDEHRREFLAGVPFRKGGIAILIKMVATIIYKLAFLSPALIPVFLCFAVHRPVHRSAILSIGSQFDSEVRIGHRVYCLHVTRG